MSINKGPQVIGEWIMQKGLGSGGFGLVHLWKNQTTGQEVAIKICRKPDSAISSFDEQKLKERWQKEVEYMTKCTTIYIVKALKLEPTSFIDALNRLAPKDFPVLPMEYCSGGDLRAQLNIMENRCGMRENVVRNILFCLRNAVEYLHGLGITHRDIKPDNIVILRLNDREIYKLTDMGYAKNITSDTIAGSLVGTKDYFAPEIITETEYKNTVDYWSVGVIAFEVICGVRPFISHQTVKTCLMKLAEKKTNHIAITENHDGLFKFHEHLFRENQCSQVFQRLIENWLVLALNTSGKGKMRGYVMNAPDERQSPSAPIMQLKFYSQLDEILKTKILKIFNLTTYKFSSFIVYEDMEMGQLLQDIQSATKIPIKDLCLIIPPEEIKAGIRPIDLYKDNWNSELPMIYIAQIGQEMKADQPVISETMKHILNFKGDEIKKHILNQFVQNSLFFIQNEQRHYLALLNGLETLAKIKAMELKRIENLLPTIKDKVLKCQGALDQLCCFVNTGENLIGNHMNGYVDVFNKTQSNITVYKTELSVISMGVFEKILTRFNSANRRITASLENNIFKTKQNDNIFEWQTLTAFLKNQQSKVTEVRTKITDIIKLCLKKRLACLEANDLKALQIEVFEIHKECVWFKDNVPKNIDFLDNFKQKIQVISEQFLVDYSRIILDIKWKSSSQEHNSSIQTDSILQSFQQIDISGDNTNFIVSEHNMLLEQLANQLNDVDMKESV